MKSPDSFFAPVPALRSLLIHRRPAACHLGAGAACHHHADAGFPREPVTSESFFGESAETLTGRIRHPNSISRSAERIKRQSHIRFVALAIIDYCPVALKTKKEFRGVWNPSGGDGTIFNHVHDT